MSAGDSADADTGRVPRLVEGCDPTQLELSPQEGFLLSRIDGHTPANLLGQLAGLPESEVAACLLRWEREGVVRFGSSGPPSPVDGDAAPGPEAPDALEDAAGDLEPGEVDLELDLEQDTQERILDFEARLQLPYHELLGVAADADPRSVKRAYFALSKEFHPDRFFRREIGAFQERIERIYRKIVEAYELLSDPTVRMEMERSLGASEGGPAREEAQPASPATPSRRRRRVSPFSPIGRLIAQRKAKAKGFFESALTSAAEERWIEAAGSLRLAIAFDPSQALYRERFGEIQGRAHEIRFEQLMKEADAALSFRDRRDALRIYEEALHCRPFDGRANHTAAKLAWVAADDLRKAKEYALRACEAEPDEAEYHRTLGQIYQAAGLRANAKRELKLALRLDPKDPEAKAALKSL